MARKLLDVSKMNSLGWRASITLKEGIRDTYGWFLENKALIRGKVNNLGRTS